MTETWLDALDLSPLSELCPFNYLFLNSPRTSGRGGGIATVYKNNFKCSQLPSRKYTSFEIQLFMVDSVYSLLCALIYRPPRYNKDFIDEFSEFLSVTNPTCNNFLMLGDFNIHVCCPSKPLASEFVQMIDSFNFTQFVSGSTHRAGHTLDLALSLGLSLVLMLW